MLLHSECKIHSQEALENICCESPLQRLRLRGCTFQTCSILNPLCRVCTSRTREHNEAAVGWKKVLHNTALVTMKLSVTTYLSYLLIYATFILEVYFVLAWLASLFHLFTSLFVNKFLPQSLMNLYLSNLTVWHTYPVLLPPELS